MRKKEEAQQSETQHDDKCDNSQPCHTLFRCHCLCPHLLVWNNNFVTHDPLVPMSMVSTTAGACPFLFRTILFKDFTMGWVSLDESFPTMYNSIQRCHNKCVCHICPFLLHKIIFSDVIKDALCSEEGRWHSGTELASEPPHLLPENIFKLLRKCFSNI